MASVLANTALSVMGRAGGLVLGLIITALLGRLLGVEQFGDYTLILSFGAILHVVTDWGLYLTLTREIARNPQIQDGVLAATAGLRLVIFVTVFVAGGLMLAIIPSYHRLLLLYTVAAGGFLFQSLSQLLMGVFQAHSTVWKALIGDISGRIVQLLGILMLVTGVAVATQNSLLVAVAAFTAGASIAYLIHAVTVPAAAWKFSFQPTVWRRILADSWPIGVMLILNAIYFRVDIVMISWFRTPAEVGWYGLAYRIVESGLFLPAVFGGLLLPKLSAAQVNKQASLISQSLFVMLIVGAPVFVVLTGAATGFVTLFAGEAFAPSGPLLTVLAAALVTMFFGNIFGFTLVATGRQRALLYLYAALAAFNAIANLVVIPHFGAAGAAWTTVATEAVSAIIAATLVYRHVPYTLSVQHVVITLMAAAAAAGLLIYLRPAVPVVIAAGISSFAYIISIAVLGLLRRSHVTLLLES